MSAPTPIATVVRAPLKRRYGPFASFCAAAKDVVIPKNSCRWSVGSRVEPSPAATQPPAKRNVPIAPSCLMGDTPVREVSARKRSDRARFSGTCFRVHAPDSTAVTAPRKEPDERMMSFSTSTTRKNTSPPTKSHGHTQRGLASLSNTRCSGGA